MSDPPDNAKKKQSNRGRWQKGQSGNPAGSKRGSRHRVTLLLEKLLDGEAEEVTRSVIEAAKNGDMLAGRIILDRLIAPRRDRPVRFKLPPLESLADAGRAMAALTTAASSGELTPGEAGELSRLIDVFVRTIEATEIEKRLQALEMANAKRT
jgi:hypothetical protein